MEQRYIKAIDPDKWIRPAGWPALPTVLPSENKVVGVYAVWEKTTNRLSINNSASAANNTVDWGDGTNVTWTGVANQVKNYDYATLPGPVLQDAGGYNYKCVVIQITINSGGGGTLHLCNTTPTPLSINGWLDIIISLPGSNWGFAIPLNRLQRFNLVNFLQAQSWSARLQNTNDLKVIEGTWFDIGNTNTSTIYQGAFLNTGLDTIGNMQFNGANPPTLRSAVTLFQTSNLKKIGNLVFTNIGITSALFSGCRRLEEVGNITSLNCTAFSTVFNGCFMLEKIGIINIGTGTLTQNIDLFNGCNRLKEVEFVDATGLINPTTNMFTNCRAIIKVRLPNLKCSVILRGCDMERPEIIDLFDDLAPVPPGTETIDIANNPGTAALTAGDIAIAGGKGWIVTTV